MAAQGGTVGQYMLLRQIGKGSFSVVWLARHFKNGTEFAVKEIAMAKLGEKLQESLLSEVSILAKISDPNIIALRDFINDEANKKIYLVLEYCRGGDLSTYIQRQGRVSEEVAKRFMQQIASGLRVLRDNNVVHRDLKPQNILLSTNDENAVLKIADFGFARLLQPTMLAETLCGSPLYMAPEVMQGQKYDAKADIWSTGVILYQLVTGQPPYNGNNQIQLMNNILNTPEPRFRPDCKLSPECIDLCRKLLRRLPLQRPKIEDVLNHPFLSEGSRTYQPSEQVSSEDCMPFPLDEETSGQDEPPTIPERKAAASMRSVFGFPARSKPSKAQGDIPSKNAGFLTRLTPGRTEASGSRENITTKSIEGHNLPTNQVPKSSSSEECLADPLEFAEQDYVFVSGPRNETLSHPVSASRPSPSKCKSSPIISSAKLSAPMPISGAATSRQHSARSCESYGSPASETSQRSVDLDDAMDQPPFHSLARLISLQDSASAVADIIQEESCFDTKMEVIRPPQALSVQLVVLAIRKQALDLCRILAASLAECAGALGAGERTSISSLDPRVLDDLSSQIEREFMREVERAEDIASHITNTSDADVPDALEIIFQSALSSGRRGAVDEMMGNAKVAALRYSRAASLLRFLLVEAPTLTMHPPLALSESDRRRLRSYISALDTRLTQLRAHQR